MRVDVLKPGNFSDWQYGFMQGRSTEDAIVRLRKIVDENRESKYILVLLFDITGAFDNVRWSLVLQGLKERKCPANVFEVLKSYFRDSTARRRRKRKKERQSEESIRRKPSQRSRFNAWPFITLGLLRIRLPTYR